MLAGMETCGRGKSVMHRMVSRRTGEGWLSGTVVNFFDESQTRLLEVELQE